MSNVILEKALVIGLKDGATSSFDRLFSLYSSRIFKFAYSILKSREDSREIVQDTFLKIWEMHQSINPDQSFKALLFTIAYNNIMSRFRGRLKELKYREHILTSASEYYNQEEILLSDDIHNQVQKIIEKLPPRRKQIFILRKENNLTYKDISEKLGISLKTVENNINLAIKFIKSQIGTDPLGILLLSFLFL